MRRDDFTFAIPRNSECHRCYPEGGVDLLYTRPDGRDVIEINLVPKTGDPQRDRLASDPVQQKKFEEDQWKKRARSSCLVPRVGFPTRIGLR